MGFDIDKVAKIIEREMLSPVLLTCLLLRYAGEDHSGLEKLIEVTKLKDLLLVDDILTMYPTTDVGWSILPASRTAFLKPELELREAADVEHLQYQEDRARVEYLRELVHPRVVFGKH